MSQIYRLSTLLLIYILAACAAPSYPPPQSLGNITEWKTQLYTEPADIKITANMQQGSTAKIQLLNDEKKNYNIPATIIITDQDCDSGHQIIIEYYATPHETLRKYFTTTIPWNSEFSLKLEQLKNSDYTLTINNESINFHRHYNAKILRIQGSNAGLTVSNFEYLKKSHADSN